MRFRILTSPSPSFLEGAQLPINMQMPHTYFALRLVYKRSTFELEHFYSFRLDFNCVRSLQVGQTHSSLFYEKGIDARAYAVAYVACAWAVYAHIRI